MTGWNVGYIRVSSTEQNTARQLDGLQLNKTYTEKLSGKDADRPVLKECLSLLREGDTLHVHSIDRLARNLVDLQNIITTLTKRGVAVHFHKESLIFSGEANPMNKLMMQLIGAVAEFERTMINERRKEGVAIARKQGIKFGRPSKLSISQVEEAKKMIASGQDKKSVAAYFGVSRTTLYDYLDPKTRQTRLDEKKRKK
jgi:DNA invertase Pin-like site-specific DNA recombinase